jgi:hypothetical protein
MNTIAKMAPAATSLPAGGDLVEMTKSTVKTTVTQNTDTKVHGRGGPRLNYAQVGRNYI